MSRTANKARLSAATLADLDASVVRPAYDRDAIGTGHVHLGIGAFARAHTAVYSDTAIANAGGDWGIAAVSLRHPAVRDRLAPQDCLYTIAVSDADRLERRLIGAIRSVHVAPEDRGAVVGLLADPATLVVTLTVTEKGYCLSPDSGRLDFGHAGIAHDAADPARPETATGFLVAAMRKRRDAGAPPFTVISCDNLPGNGRRLGAAVREFAAKTDPDLVPWIESSVRFPATMVDRIVPATTDDDLAAATDALGLVDEGVVCTESFSQWVIEDAFANERPAWELAGAMFVDDVEPYERAKLRLLNGAHSSLAYLGYLAGFDYVHEVMQDDAFEAFARKLMTVEISPVTPEPRGMEHGTYIDALLQRFRNSSLRHRTWQIAMDGSQKLPQRLLDTVREQLRRDGPIDGVAIAIAAWIRYTLGRDEAGDPIDVQDPLAERFASIASEYADVGRIVDRYLDIAEVFGTDLAGERRFASALDARLRELMERGAAATVRDYAAGSVR